MGPPTHPNTVAFHHNPSSRLTKYILQLPVNGLCSSCVEIIEWRKRYRKYKPLTAPKKWYVALFLIVLACGVKKKPLGMHIMLSVQIVPKVKICAKNV